MAFKLTRTKHEKSKDKEKKGIAFMDIRVFAGLMLFAFVGMLVLIGFGVKNAKETQTKIVEEKKQYEQNQLAIDNLKGLQSRSAEYEAQRAAYADMIPETQDLQQIMIEMEQRTEQCGCVLTEITFAGAEGEETAEAAQSDGGLAKEQAVDLQVRGKYEDIMKFAKNISQDKEFMRVDGIQLSPGEKGDMNAKITVVKFSKA